LFGCLPISYLLGLFSFSVQEFFDHFSFLCITHYIIITH